eukprot:CAMPEP_0182421124 /NCGR_PEP_ID=MMETSP1167-20130531/6351_1 /TAXON_ID=2988 /ORGANISM="Mallomonas Sp, Strain CCMP3275" /LENGTH=85 /DNA_ID=CAMNT_0024597929 /DNA_START=153 /DNA_END=410 /DNA_ORIENTATION=-
MASELESIPDKPKELEKIGQAIDGRWPHVVGMDVEEAVAAIKSTHPELHVHSVPEGAMVTMDMRMDRVRVWFGADKKVVNPPHIG